MPDTITADRAVSRVHDLSECIEDAEAAIAERIDGLLDDLQTMGAFRIHREWSASEERKLICRAAAKAAVRAALTSDWVDLPAECAWLHITRHEQEREPCSGAASSAKAGSGQA